MQAYECLALLEGTSMKAQRALESGTHVNLKEAKNLNSYFQKVRARVGRGTGLMYTCPCHVQHGTSGGSARERAD